MDPMIVALLIVVAVTLMLVSYVVGFVSGHYVGEKAGQGHPITWEVLIDKESDR